jgi:hypothetical protein
MVSVDGKDQSFMRDLFPLGYMVRTNFRSVDTWTVETRFYVIFSGNYFPAFVSCLEEGTRLMAILSGYDIEPKPSAYRIDGRISPEYYYAIKRQSPLYAENSYGKP